MIRRSMPLLTTFVALLLVLLTAAPAFAYGEDNSDHLRLTRLDRLECGRPIRIQAELTDSHGHAVKGATIHFTIAQGKPGDRVVPANVRTNAHGEAIAVVTLVCSRGTQSRQILATGPNGAQARITLNVPGQDHNRDVHHPAGNAWYLLAGRVWLRW